MQDAPDATDDLCRSTFLGNKAVGASLKPEQYIHGVGLAGANDDGDEAEFGIGLESSAEVEATVPGEVEVAEYDVEVFVDQALKAGFGFGDEDDLKSGLFENEAEVLGLGGTVLDDDHARHCSVLLRFVRFAQLPSLRNGSVTTTSSRASRVLASAFPLVPRYPRLADLANECAKTDRTRSGSPGS